MKGRWRYIIGTILLLIIVTGCSFFEWGLRTLGGTGINARLSGVLEVDGEVYELATYQGKLYALAVEGTTQVFYEIDENTFGLVEKYELVGDPVEDLHHGSGDMGPRLGCFEDSLGSFLIMDQFRASRFWLNPSDTTALHLSAGDNHSRLNIYFSSSLTGFDFIIRYQTGGAIEVWDLVSDAVTMSLNAPPDKFLFDAVEIVKDDVEYLRLMFVPTVPVGSENERVKLPVRLTVLDLEYGVTPESFDYPYGGEELFIDIPGESVWNDWTTEGGTLVKYPGVKYFRFGSSYYMVRGDDISYNGVLLYGLDGSYYETFFIDREMKPIISDSLPLVYGAQGNKILKYSLD